MEDVYFGKIKNNRPVIISIVIMFILLTISPYILMRFFLVGFDNSITAMLLGQIALSIYSYKKLSKILPGFNFNVIFLKGNVFLFLAFVLISIFQSCLFVFFSQPYQYEPVNVTLPLVITLLFIVPFYEEIFFRGVLFGFISSIFNGSNLPCCITTTLCFCLIHLESYELYQQLNIFISGLLLFYIRKKTASLTYPIALHSAMNFLSLSIR